MERIFELDVESFFIIARIFMDKIGKMLECYCNIPEGNAVGSSFTRHKAFFLRPENRHYNLKYSELLESRTTWFELDLLFSRDKLIIHSKTTDAPIIDTNFVALMKIDSKHDWVTRYEERLSMLAKKYGIMKSNDKCTIVHPSTILHRLIRNNVKIEKNDQDFLGQVIQETGGFLDVISLARNIKHFVIEVSEIFCNTEKLNYGIFSQNADNLSIGMERTKTVWHDTHFEDYP
jgi:hypothetical protein